MGTDIGAPYEKVLILDIDTLDRIADELYLYLKVNPDDIECPEEIKKKDIVIYDIPDEVTRKRVSTQRWERNRYFRNSVLWAYNCKCAICRCGEEKLLEAVKKQLQNSYGIRDIFAKNMPTKKA